jgi:predicted ABC-type ATPase
VRIDQPADPADDLAQEGDGVLDRPAAEHPVLVASDAKPSEPRTRFEHADDTPPPDDPEAPVDENAQTEDLSGDSPDEQPSHEIDGAADQELLDNDAFGDEGERPLTDKEWAEHLAEVRDGLGQAREAGLITKHLYTIDPDRRVWTADRNRIQGSLVAELYEKAKDVPCDRSAIIAGGLGGAGKTTVLTQHAGIDLSKYLTINPDDIKEEMARCGMIPEVNGLSPMEATDLAHEESSHIAKRLALRASAEGKNIIWDITMSATDSTEERIKTLRDADYTRIDGLFVEIPVETSVQRTDARHREGHEAYRSGTGLGGRYVPAELITSQRDPEWGCQNRRTYEAAKTQFDSWSIYDNSVDGQPPALIASKERTWRHGGTAQ